jgi:hypothetical protein
VGFCCGQTDRCGRVSVWAARSAGTRFSLQTGGFTRASRVYAPHEVLIDRRRRSPQAGIPDYNAIVRAERIEEREPVTA